MENEMDLISIAEAAKLIGRHEKTIRRWIRKQLDTDPEAREKIVQEAIASGFGYRIDRNYLLAYFPSLLNTQTGQEAGHSPEQNTGQPTGQPSQPLDALIAAKDETIALLKEQVRQQQDELNRKNEQLNTMLERLREQNILLKGYQEKYLLEAPKAQKEVDRQLDTSPEQDTVHSPDQGGQTNPPSMNTNHKPRKRSQKSEQAQRKGFLSFFRRK